MTRVILFGSREFRDEGMIRAEIVRLKRMYPDLVVVHGDCPSGADFIAKNICREMGIREEPHAADWARYGKSAGMIRNRKMAELGALGAYGFSVSDPYTPGTRDMMRKCVSKGIPVIVYLQEVPQEMEI